MRRIRVIPSLLISRGKLIKSLKFKNPTYLGDPINAVKIFNEKEVDEIAILDITATAEKRGPNITYVRELASEAFMPLAYGGGITTLAEIKELIGAGIEKVILNFSAFKNPALISDAAKSIGSQSVVASIDVKKNLWGKPKVFIRNGTENTSDDPLTFAKRMEDLGAGEILLNSIDRDGTFAGYDCDLIQSVASGVSIPVIAVGGAATTKDFHQAVQSGASAVSAGSMFVYQGPHRAVLISYPSQKDLHENLFQLH